MLKAQLRMYFVLSRRKGMCMNNNRRKVGLSIVILTLLLLPALYALIFLGAYWDPTSNMSNIPVAVVNNDKGCKFRDISSTCTEI